MKTARILASIVVFLGISGSAALGQALPTATATNSTIGSAPVAGVHGGYNWQRDSFVFGFEGDLSSGPHSLMTTTTAAPAVTATTAADVDWYGTVRGRIGFTPGPVLIYATGGLAYGNPYLSGTMTMPVVPFSTTAQASPVRAGWVAGGGIDYMVLPNLLLNFAYQYVDLGSAGIASTATSGADILTQSVTSRARFQVFTVGLSWLFSPDKPHGAWEGLYGGGHVGGAWGETTDASYFARGPVPVSDVRLKRDIVLIGRFDDGLGVYRYRYLWSDTEFVGVMAQEVALIHPEAIVRQATDDYLRVDYGRLGLKLMTWPQWQAASRGERL
jgi:outer membrane immunogenic protein